MTERREKCKIPGIEKILAGASLVNVFAFTGIADALDKTYSFPHRSTALLISTVLLLPYLFKKLYQDNPYN